MICCLLLNSHYFKKKPAAKVVFPTRKQLYLKSKFKGDGLENYLLLPFTDGHRGPAPLLPGHYGCVEALLTWGADVDMDIPHLGTALYTACICQELQCAGKLLREGQFSAALVFPNAEVAAYGRRLHTNAACRQISAFLLQILSSSE